MISAVAERARGAARHRLQALPLRRVLFGACSAHWLAQHPLPDLVEWVAVADPEECLRVALSDLYVWYESGGEMLEGTTRDTGLVPAMRALAELRLVWLAEAAATIVRGRRERGVRRRRVEATRSPSPPGAPSFASRASRQRAIDLMCGLVALAARR